jgi:ADP-heptose:LPS heptosyltransferase
MLVAAPGRWDEACFMVPAMRALMASGLQMGVICPVEQREFWETLDGIVLVECPAKARALAPLIAGKWQASLVWEQGLAADAMELAKIPRRLGPAQARLKRRITHALEAKVAPLEHRVRFYLSAVAEMGVETGKAEFFLPAEMGIDPVRHAVLLSPESDFGPSHEWSLDGWLEIGRRLMENGARVTVAGVDGKKSGMADALAGELGEGVEFFRASPMGGALPVFAVHGLVVAADGSLPHLAAHAGATCVTLFGPNDPQWKRPLGKRHAVVRRHVECAPCLLAKCPLDMRCQRELDVDRVWAALEAKWNRAG